MKLFSTILSEVDSLAMCVSPARIFSKLNNSAAQNASRRYCHKNLLDYTIYKQEANFHTPS